MGLKRFLVYAAVVIIFGFTLYSCGGGGGSSKPSTPSTPKPSIKSWSVIVYMDGDNSLSAETEDDLLEMEEAGSSNEINIVAQVDTKTDPVKRYFIERDNAKLIQNLGELDMSDPKTLSDFVVWAIKNYPAEHYLLVLWNHGGGFKYKSVLFTKDIFEDDHYDNGSVTSIMSIPELSSALSSISSNLSRKIDIVGFDDCLMNMLEIAYQIKNTADFMVGSENTEPFSGWPYNYILFDLSSNPSMSAKELSQTIVKEYINSYIGYTGITQSAIDLSKIDNIADRLNSLSILLIAGIDNETVKSALQNKIFTSLQRFDDNGDGIIDSDDSYVDLDNLSKEIESKLPIYANQAKSLVDAIKNAVIANGYVGHNMAGADGLSIWYPNPSVYSQSQWLYYWKHYEALSFAENNNWDEFIYNLWFK